MRIRLEELFLSDGQREEQQAAPGGSRQREARVPWAERLLQCGQVPNRAAAISHLLYWRCAGMKHLFLVILNIALQILISLDFDYI